MEICAGVLRTAVVEGRVGGIGFIGFVTSSVLQQHEKQDRNVECRPVYGAGHYYDGIHVPDGEGFKKEFPLLSRQDLCRWLLNVCAFVKKDCKMYTQQIQAAGLTCSLFLPRHYDENDRRYPVIYINGDVPVDEIIDEIERNGSEAAFVLLAVCPGNWNDDFTPWSAPAFRKGEDAPRGLADAYIARLTEEIKPHMDANFRTKPEPEYTALFGYSLGGLAAIYAIYV